MNDYQAIVEQFYHNKLLFGDLADSGIVALEIAAPNEVEVFKRQGAAIARERRPLRLFLMTADRALLKGLSVPHTTEELKGDFHFRYLSIFSNLGALEAAKRHLRAVTGKTAGSADAQYLVLADPIEQHLLLSGSTFFMGLEFGDLRRMQLHIETAMTPGFEFPSAARPDDRIVAIAIRDSAGLECVLSSAELDEKAMLLEFARIVAERDPDVIEGHGLFRFTLEYIEARARRWSVALKLGRDGSVPRARASRMQIAERTIAYRRAEIYGRSLIDTWILAQHYDVSSRELEGFELAELARHFRIAAAGRKYVEPRRAGLMMEQEPATLIAHAGECAREVGTLAELLASSYFVQAQIFPYSYQNIVLRGNATKIDSLMLRTYLAERHSVPLPSEAREFPGGYTEVRRCGVAREVLHCDVTSLYPSLMLSYSHGPSNDKLGVFLKLLADLRSFRVQAKQLARELAGPARRNLEALQQTFKILINSFYGYLGFGLGHFNDFAQAADVTRRGRELIRRTMNELEDHGAQVVEVDTDGIYFVAPAGIYGDETAQAALLDRLDSTMPEGIKLEIDGRYRAMFSYKMKNYVLLDEAGEMTIRGSGLKSRGLERFQRRFMEEMFGLLMRDRHGEVPALLAAYQSRLERHELGIEELMKTETLQESLEAYRQKIGGKRRNAAAAYELALKAGRPYSAGDRISYYVAGKGLKVKVNAAARIVTDYNAARPDENVEYYKAKLAELFEKFRPFVERPGLFDASALDASNEPAQGTIFETSGDPSE